MSDDADLLKRADALMRPKVATDSAVASQLSHRLPRRRAFLAVSDPGAVPEQPHVPLEFGGEDDLPLLTDVVRLPTTTATEQRPESATERRAELAEELSDRLHRRLTVDLQPMLDDLLCGADRVIREHVRTALAEVVSDFVAQRGQLCLPLAPAAADHEDREDDTPG